jgi:hypothetical protein
MRSCSGISGSKRGAGTALRIEQRLGAVGRGPAGAAAGVAVQHREVELVLVGVEVDEEVVDLIEHLLRASVRAIDLVDHHDGGKLRFERLAQDEAGLRQRPLAGIDQQHHAVDHHEGALHLAAEVGVPGGVNDVDPGPSVGDGGVLRHDGNALLPLEVDGVHDALHDSLVLAEDPALPQHRVHERGLAVVHVRDDRHVPDRVACLNRHRPASPSGLRRTRCARGTEKQITGSSPVRSDGNTLRGEASTPQAPPEERSL